MTKTKHVLQRVALIALVVALTGLAPQAYPQSQADEKTVLVEKERAGRGKVTYRLYCQNCHGKTGEGDGSIAELLKVPPADLTRIAQDGDGEFPADRVYEVIDGRQEVTGHGRREMPIWGVAFQDPGRDSDQEAEVRDRILNLVSFLKSIQVSE